MHLERFAELDVEDAEIVDACETILTMREDGESYDAIVESLTEAGWDSSDVRYMMLYTRSILLEASFATAPGKRGRR